LLFELSVADKWIVSRRRTGRSESPVAKGDVCRWDDTCPVGKGGSHCQRHFDAIS